MNPPVGIPDFCRLRRNNFLSAHSHKKVKQLIAEHIEEDATWFGHSFVVEHRFAWTLAYGMKAAGWPEINRRRTNDH
jgi:hypothetical protein